MTEPEPDLASLRPHADAYAESHPGAEDVLLLIEIADTSLLSDRRRKRALYAREGVQETWLVDLPHEQVEVYRRPERARLSPLAFPDLSISVHESLG
jgi:Uma2 family endonuclease